jgi:predicted nucleic acid-binding Zn finger protein
MEKNRLQVLPVAGEAGRFHVKSAKSELLYLVDLDELTAGWCGCPHFEYRSGLELSPVIECKHILAVKEYLREKI